MALTHTCLFSSGSLATVSDHNPPARLSAKLGRVLQGDRHGEHAERALPAVRRAERQIIGGMRFHRRNVVRAGHSNHVRLWQVICFEQRRGQSATAFESFSMSILVSEH